jgi:hypothetical protein
MPDSPPKRVRVVLGDRGQRGNPVPHARRELTEQTRVGDALVRGLVRAQFALAVRVAAVVVVGLGGLPLVFTFAPRLAAARPFGVALPWLLLGLAAYPFLLVVGVVYVKLAERNEREFAELVERRDQ